MSVTTALRALRAFAASTSGYQNAAIQTIVAYKVAAFLVLNAPSQWQTTKKSQTSHSQQQQ